jgi:hypothetical protein
MNKHLRVTLPIALIVFAAAWLGWTVARPPTMIFEPAKMVTPVLKSAPAPVRPVGWVPPEGDPVQRLKACKTKEERMEIIGAFMTLGHDHNGLMLIEALKDESVQVRVQAVEYAASLPPEVSALVLKEAVLNDLKDVREIGWSLLAPHPLENKAPVLMAAIERGSDVVLEEAFNEMGRTPEMPLFEAMLAAGTQAKDARRARVFKELQEWLKPGGGEVPAFKSVNEMMIWWAANKKRYDQFMLRVDL